MTDEITRLVRFTSKGLDEVLQAKNQGLKGEITHVGAGTGRYNPNGTEVALRDERQRVAIVDYEDLGNRQLRMAALFDGEGEYEIGEFGFYLASGTLLAVYSVAGTLLTPQPAYSPYQCGKKRAGPRHHHHRASNPRATFDKQRGSSFTLRQRVLSFGRLA